MHYLLIAEISLFIFISCIITSKCWWRNFYLCKSSHSEALLKTGYVPVISPFQKLKAPSRAPIYNKVYFMHSLCVAGLQRVIITSLTLTNQFLGQTLSCFGVMAPDSTKGGIQLSSSILMPPLKHPQRYEHN